MLVQPLEKVSISAVCPKDWKQIWGESLWVHLVSKSLNERVGGVGVHHQEQSLNFRNTSLVNVFVNVPRDRYCIKALKMQQQENNINEVWSRDWKWRILPKVWLYSGATGLSRAPLPQQLKSCGESVPHWYFIVEQNREFDRSHLVPLSFSLCDWWLLYPFRKIGNRDFKRLWDAQKYWLLWQDVEWELWSPRLAVQSITGHCCGGSVGTEDAATIPRQCAC